MFGPRIRQASRITRSRGFPRAPRLSKRAATPGPPPALSRLLSRQRGKALISSAIVWMEHPLVCVERQATGVGRPMSCAALECLNAPRCIYVFAFPSHTAVKRQSTTSRPALSLMCQGDL